MKITRDTLDQSVLSAVACAGFFNLFSPNFAEVRANQSDADLLHLRESYRPAVATSLFLGLGLSLLAHSPLPIVAAGATSMAMVGIYEHALPPDRRLLSGRLRLLDPNIIDGAFTVIS